MEYVDLGREVHDEPSCIGNHGFGHACTRASTQLFTSFTRAPCQVFDRAPLNLPGVCGAHAKEKRFRIPRSCMMPLDARSGDLKTLVPGYLPT